MVWDLWLWRCLWWWRRPGWRTCRALRGGWALLSGGFGVRLVEDEDPSEQKWRPRACASSGLEGRCIWSALMMIKRLREEDGREGVAVYLTRQKGNRQLARLVVVEG